MTDITTTDGMHFSDPFAAQVYQNALDRVNLAIRTTKLEHPANYPWAIVRENMDGTSGERIIVDLAATRSAAERIAQAWTDAQHSAYYIENDGFRIGVTF